MNRKIQSFVVAAVLATLGGIAHAETIQLSRDYQALTANNTAPANWRVTDGKTFEGKTFDGAARISFSNSQGNWGCSGTLLAGGLYVLTAAHCADDFTSMRVDFGVYNNVAKETRGVAWANVHSAWTGELGVGTDIALIRLDHQVTSIEGFNLSTTFDLGKDFLIMGYGTTGVGNLFNTPTNWADRGWAHWGTNTADVTSNVFNAAIWGEPESQFEEYVADFDGPSGSYNSLQLLANAYAPGAWTSATGTGASEALIAGGDSGGGDFIWNGEEWLLSGVHSWGRSVYSGTNGSRWGNLSGSTAVFSHLDWIRANAVPEPGSLVLVMGSLFAVCLVRRRKQA